MGKGFTRKMVVWEIFIPVRRDVKQRVVNLKKMLEALSSAVLYGEGMSWKPTKQVHNRMSEMCIDPGPASKASATVRNVVVTTS